ncbi:MAG: hypothetical protein LC130_20215 [Bryobacterales bacterium]|nr:hypothetical protein [Bryobacterales bacterium]MEB2361439.1 hypothetical protein [Bryobacterales bacterium]
MKLHRHWWRGGGRSCRSCFTTDQRERLERLLHAAAERGLRGARPLSIEDFSTLPPADPHEVTTRLPTFRREALPSDTAPLLHYPIRPLPRLALLGTSLKSDGDVREFNGAWSPALQRFRPQALVAPAPVLLALADFIQRRPVSLNSLTHPIVALSGPSYGVLSTQDRDRLWHTWRVPLFEQFRGCHDELLAWECEAHCGLHFDDAQLLIEASEGDSGLLITDLTSLDYPVLRLASGVEGTIETAPCGCGRTLPRLANLKSTQGIRAIQAAAAV